MMAAVPARQASMFPVWEAKINRAGPVPPPAVITKSELPLKTLPVGRAGGILTVNAFFASGLPLTSPPYSVAVLVPLFAIQNGLVALDVMPHGLTSKGS